MSLRIHISLDPSQYRALKMLADRAMIPLTELCKRMVINGKNDPGLLAPIVKPRRAVSVPVLKGKPIEELLESKFCKEDPASLFSRGFSIIQIAAKLRRPYGQIAKEIGAAIDREATDAHL